MKFYQYMLKNILQMGHRFWVVEFACGWFMANGWSEEGAGFVGMLEDVCGFVGMVGFDETHNK